MSPSLKNFRRALLVLVVAAGALGILFLRSEPPKPPAKKPAAAAAPAVVATNAAAPLPGGYAPPQKPLFAIITQTDQYAWTTNDARQPQFIRELAHNDLEYQRMLDENDRITRRQLVYHKGAFSLAAQAARLGQPVSQLTLPGLDGQELNMQVLKSEIEAGGDRGNFSGRLAGRDNSLVTIAFAGGREAFTVVSPDDNLNLVAEPREPGELVVKSIIPDLYGGSFAGDDAVVLPGKK